MSIESTLLRTDIEVDVSQGHLAGTVVAPSTTDVKEAPVALVCVPGMSYRRTYWDLQIEGETGYSFAEHAAALGQIVVTLDNIGTGDSSPPAGGGDVGYTELGTAIAEASKVIAARVADGTLVAGLEAVADARMVGVGHSMGAGTAVAALALGAPWRAVAPLGFPALGAPFLFDGAPEDAVDTVEKRRDWARETIAVTMLGRRFDDIETFFMIDRPSYNYIFYGDDVPESVIAADIALATVAPRMAWLDAVQPRESAGYVRGTQVPVFLAYGTREFTMTPRAEASAFESCNDITTVVLENTAHCHNLAGSRTRLWDRLCGWAEAVA
jgi:pimeloyl-ACP methyl ester carboxylesterase